MRSKKKYLNTFNKAYQPLPLQANLARSAGFGEAPQQADFCVLAGGRNVKNSSRVATAALLAI